jgi:hypothetical protein
MVEGYTTFSNCIPHPHPTYKKVFEHLHLLWMGRLLHTHTVITTDISKDSGELAETEILGDLSV